MLSRPVSSELQNTPDYESDRFKICHVVILPHLTGVQRYMLGICERLDPERYDRHVVCQSEGPLTEELDKIGVKYHLIPSLVRPIRPFTDLRGYLALRKFFRQQSFDLVHTHSSKTGLFGRVAARRVGVPNIIHHVHGFSFHEFSSAISRIFYSRIEKVAAGYCDKVVFVNDEERVMSVDKGWIPEEKAMTILNGTDVELFDRRNNLENRQQFRADHELADDEVAILYCARLDIQKQCMILPDIVKALDKRCPDVAWRLFVAGTGELEDEFKAKIERLGVGKRFELLGWCTQPRIPVSGADLFMLPSLWEGLPLSLIEAQAASLPIVASNIKGNREVVTEETGFLCKPKDADGYAEALEKLICNAELRNRLSLAARRRAESHFDVQETFAKVLRLYEELLDRSP